MATDRQLSKADMEQRLKRIFRLMCVGGVTSLLATGCANMKPGEGSAASTPQSATAVQAPVQAAKQKPAPAPVPAVADVKKADAAAELTADQLVASLAKPASEVVVPVKPAPAPMPVVKVEPAPKRVVELKPLAAPVVKVEPVPASEIKPAPVVVTAPVSASEPAPAPAQAVSAPVVAEAAAPNPAPVAEMANGSDLLSADSGSSAPVSKNLPIRFDLWRIDKGRGPYDASAVMITPTFQMGNNKAAAQIYVTVMDDKVLVTSSSTIAGKNGLSGIRIDEGGWLPFTDITEDNVAVVRGNWLDKLEAGSKLTIRLGFFPDMSKSPEQFESEVPLTDMRSAIPRYRKLLN